VITNQNGKSKNILNQTKLNTFRNQEGIVLHTIIIIKKGIYGINQIFNFRIKIINYIYQVVKEVKLQLYLIHY